MKIPRAGVSQVFGLLDVVRAYGGKTDIAHLNLDFHLDLDELLPIIDTAVMVGLVTVREGDISLTDLGKKLLTSKMEARKRLIGEQLAKTELYSELLKVLSIRTSLTRAMLAKVIEAKTGPESDIDDIVSFVIRWGVFAGLFNYDGSKGQVVAKTSSRA